MICRRNRGWSNRNPRAANAVRQANLAAIVTRVRIMGCSGIIGYRSRFVFVGRSRNGRQRWQGQANLAAAQRQPKRMQDFYFILGLDEDASPDQVHAAFRRLAKRYHPDVSGADSARDFLEVQEAWQTLGDEQRRRQYDENLRRSRQRPPQRVPKASANRPVRDAVADDWFPNGSTLHVELHVTAEEVKTGGEVPLELPVMRPCAACKGAGFGGFGYCVHCGGAGQRSVPQRFVLQVPEGLRAGEVLVVALPEVCARYRRLAVHVSVR